jgi:hypothetical protein
MMTRIRTLFTLLRDHDAIQQQIARDKAEIALQRAMNGMIAEAAEQSARNVKRLSEEYAAVARMWQDEIARLTQASAEDARMIRALHRWCEQKKCPPSPRDLKALMGQ